MWRPFSLASCFTSEVSKVVGMSFVDVFGAAAASVTEGSGVGSVLDLEIVSNGAFEIVSSITCTFCAFFLALLN